MPRGSIRIISTSDLRSRLVKRLGILGTFVWDRIWTLADQEAGRPFETWGGMSYSISAAAAACPAGWEIVPVAKVGSDLVEEARAYSAALPRVDAAASIISVPVPNNRVELRYFSADRRGERLSGGVPAWTWDELAPHAEGLDALLVNYFSGFELTLEATEQLRANFHGPLYADLHSLFLGCPSAETRQHRPLADWERWVACFDAVQLNEDELRTLVGGEVPSWTDGAARVLRHGPGLVAVTLGPEGAAVAERIGLAADPMVWGLGRGTAEDGLSAAIHPTAGPAQGDPTGCGDVWGTTFFTRLLAGDGIAGAVERAHAAARRKLGHRGATDLYPHLLVAAP